MAPIPAAHRLPSDGTSDTARLLHRAMAASSTIHNLIPRAKPVNPNWDPAAGSKPPQTFNNKGFFALFALLGAAMVIASIWFFFWAKNGGFVWRKNDWDDYKSTVLRRKGPDGKTLSNATPRTQLGHRSVAGTFDNERPQMTEIKDFGARNSSPRRHHHREKHHHSPGHKPERQPSDEDVRAYRHEKAARVGGLNREHDGSHFGLSSTEGSEVVSNSSQVHLRPKTEAPKKKGFLDRKREKRSDKKVEKHQQKKGRTTDKKKEQSRHKSADHTTKRPAQRRQSLSTAADSTVADSLGDGNNNSDTYYDNYRPPVQPYASRHESPRRHSALRNSQQQQPNIPTRSGRASPRKPTPHNRTPGSFDAYSEAGSSDTGTKSYSHHIPDLSRGSRDTGFRRGATGRRRVSLSDSD